MRTDVFADTAQHSLDYVDVVLFPINVAHTIHCAHVMPRNVGLAAEHSRPSRPRTHEQKAVMKQAFRRCG